jgi:hypothetical protein
MAVQKLEFELNSNLTCDIKVDNLSDFLTKYTYNITETDIDVCDSIDVIYDHLASKICPNSNSRNLNTSNTPSPTYNPGRNLEEEEPSTMFKYLIYLILIICVIGFAYFIINWIRCVMSRPKDLEDSEEDDDEEVYDPSGKRAKQMEMQNVLP